MKKLSIVILIVMAAAFLLAGCGSGTGTNGSDTGTNGNGSKSTGTETGSTSGKEAFPGITGTEKHLNFALFWISDTMDPADSYNGWVLSRVGAGETLIRIDENAKLESCLADSWEQKDENTWVFHIREGVTFSNGNSVDAKACMDSIQRAYDNNDRSSEYFLLGSMSAEGQNLTIVTKQPCGAILNNLCEPLFTIVDTSGEEGTMDTKPVCTGPYIIQDFRPEVSVELVKNDGYWDGEPGLDSISVTQVSDSDSRVLAMQSGESDLTTTIDSSNLELFSDKSKYTVSKVLGPRCNVIYLNNKRGFCSDSSLREALSYAIDRNIYAELIGGMPAEGLYSKALACGNGLEAYNYDKDRANRILDKAGYADTDGDGIRNINGKNIVLEYYLAADHGSGDSAIIAQAVQSDAQEIGIQIDLVQSENLADIKSSGAFDMISANDSTAPTADPEVFLQLHYLTGASGNYGGYSSSKADELIGSLTGVFDLDKRQDIAREVSQIILDDGANLYISYIYGNTVSSAKVKNAVQYPIDYYIITKDITIEEK